MDDYQHTLLMACIQYRITDFKSEIPLVDDKRKSDIQFYIKELEDLLEVVKNMEVSA